MRKAEKQKADGFPTRASLERDLPDDVDEWKRLATDLVVQRPVLESGLELVKKTWALPQDN